MFASAVPETSRLYHPRTPSDSPLWRVLDEAYEEFRRSYPAVYQKRYGYFRPVVDEVVEDYLTCGDLQQGFARVRCTTPGCRNEYLLAFSCKGRWFCPSCHEKRVVQFGEQVLGEVLYPVPHRQFVFTVPILLRGYFRHNQPRLTALCQCAAASLQTWLREVLRLPDGVLGMVVVIHTFGDFARFHPHLHAIVADGLFRPNGVFHVAPARSTQPLEELFRAGVLRMLGREGKIDDARIRMLLGWRHSGFSTYRGERIARDNRRGHEALAQYVMRNAFAVEKMTYVPETGTVVYKSKMTEGKNRKNFEVFQAGEFIAAVTQHIPGKGFQMVRYYGWYSNRARGERKKRGLMRPGEVEAADGAAVIDVREHEPVRVPSKTWRQLIQKVWEVDPLRCPRCGGEMKIVALIQEAGVIERILKHLGLWKERTAAPPNAEVAEAWPAVECDYEEVDDGWPRYEEPVYVH